MIVRVENGVAYVQAWDYENRLVEVTRGTQVTRFTYDADGALVKREVGGETTVYVGNLYEKDVAGGEVRKYYYFNGQRVALRKAGVLQYVLGDHLGSTSVVLNDDGSVHSEGRYYPYGVTRWRSGTLPTDYRFTGQREDGYIKLYHMGARWYDVALGRWISADVIVPEPGNAQSLNRYSWVLGNPLRYIDRTGHKQEGSCPFDDEGCEEPPSPGTAKWLEWLLSVGTAKVALAEMYALPLIWLAEFGDRIQTFGPDDPLTLEIKSDPAMGEFFEAWTEAGHPERFDWEHTIDDRSEETPLLARLVAGAAHYARQNAEMALAPVYPGTLESQVDAVGGIMGSFDRISATEVAPGVAWIEVRNEMGWASFSRVPGTNWSFLSDSARGDAGIGGTVTFIFYWCVEIPGGAR
jgi:RHS repeat-associated protein